MMSLIYIQEVLLVLSLFPLQNIEKTLLKFAEENFGDKYFASLDGGNKRIRPLELAVKRRRPLWIAKDELIILKGLEKFVEGEGEEEFCRALNAIITEELLTIEPKVSHGACSCQFGVDNSGAWEVTNKLLKDWAGRDLGLGKLTRKIITDPENPRKWSLMKKKNILHLSEV